ncbi:MAG: MarR family winged helix-turn-helix transcriptional regulator [Fimbriimonas sp.]|nr:MarR family winged helix-turn-helix transcriptional regulator [Fimbriimonas sp.]
MKDSLAGQAGLLSELLTSAMEPKLKQADISLGTFELLSAIYASGGRSTQVEVARRLGITPPSLSESVKAACSRALVEQHADAGDARRKILKLTSKGRKAMQSIVKEVNVAESKMVEGIDAAHLGSAIEVLRRVNRNLARFLQDAANGPQGK